MCSMGCFLGVLAFLFRNCGKKSLRWRWRFGALRSILCFYCSFDKVTPECLCNANAYEYFGDSSLICEPRTHMRSISCDFRENSVKIVTWTIPIFCRKSGAIVDLGHQMGPAQTDRPIEPKIGKVFNLSDSWDRLQGLVVFGILVFVFFQLKLIENVCFCCYRGVKFTFFCAH